MNPHTLNSTTIRVSTHGHYTWLIYSSLTTGCTPTANHITDPDSFFFSTGISITGLCEDQLSTNAEVQYQRDGSTPLHQHQSACQVKSTFTRNNRPLQKVIHRRDFKGLEKCKGEWGVHDHLVIKVKGCKMQPGGCKMQPPMKRLKQPRGSRQKWHRYHTDTPVQEGDRVAQMRL